MADESSVRRRKPEPATDTPPESDSAESQDEEPKRDAPKKSKKKSTQDRLEEDESSGHVLDIFRVLTFLVLAYFGLSYLVSSGETYSWGITDAPKYLKTDWWMKQLVRPAPSPLPLPCFHTSNKLTNHPPPNSAAPSTSLPTS
jgi:hypothetical protein